MKFLLTKFTARQNYLLVNSEPNVKVLMESTYYAEMYRILANWLTKIHGFEITGLNKYAMMVIPIIFIVT